MPRGKKIVIERPVKDPVVSKVKAVKISDLVERRAKVEEKLHDSISSIVSQAQALSTQKRLEREQARNMGLLSIDEAYDEVKKAGVPISFRAFGGRIERRSIRSEKIGKKRLIPKHVIHDWISLHREYYSVKQAYNELRKTEDINFRAFIGRIEKASIPSLKIGTQRWVPRDVIEGLCYINKNYYDVSQAVGTMLKRGIKIKRNAFERRLDRNRIPHEKIGGRRVIAREVLDELVMKELALIGKP